MKNKWLVVFWTVLLGSLSSYSYAQSASQRPKAQILEPATTSAVVITNAKLKQLLQQQSSIKKQISYQINQLALLKMQEIQLKQQLAKTGKQQDNGFFWAVGTFDKLPENAYPIDAKAKVKTYICRTHYFNNVYPGRLTKQGCVITYAGKTYTQNNYRVLVSKKAGFWQAGDKTMPEIQYQQPFGPIYPYRPVIFSNVGIIANGQQTNDKVNNKIIPVIAGHENGHYVYICRVKLNDKYLVGKVVGASCNFAWQGKEAAFPSYQVLLPNAPSKQIKNNLIEEK